MSTAYALILVNMKILLRNSRMPSKRENVTHEHLGVYGITIIITIINTS